MYFLSTSQAGIYDGYYVLGYRGIQQGDDVNIKLNNYANQGKELRDTSNFIIDSRGNTGSHINEYTEQFYKTIPASILFSISAKPTEVPGFLITVIEMK